MSKKYHLFAGDDPTDLPMLCYIGSFETLKEIKVEGAFTERSSFSYAQIAIIEEDGSLRLTEEWHKWHKPDGTIDAHWANISEIKRS